MSNSNNISGFSGTSLVNNVLLRSRECYTDTYVMMFSVPNELEYFCSFLFLIFSNTTSEYRYFWMTHV